MPGEGEYVADEEKAARMLFRALNRLLEKAVEREDRLAVASAVINMMRLEEAYPHLELTEMIINDKNERVN